MGISSVTQRRTPGTLIAAVGSAALLGGQSVCSGDTWRPAHGTLQTRWTKEVSPNNALPEYPRPQMVRKDWLNLNGLWDYAVTDSGVVPDTSPGKNPARVMGAPAYHAMEGPGSDGAFTFNGRQDYLVIPRVVQDDFTIALWIKTTQTGPTGNWSGAIGLVDGECPGVTDDFGTALVGDRFALGIGNPDITLLSKTAVNDGKWHHVAAVRTRSTGSMQVYVDGQLEATAIGCDHSLTVPERLTIGQIQTGNHRFEGSMADVRIYSRPLGAAEIEDLSRPAKHPEASTASQPAGLVGHWRFDNPWIQPQRDITYTGRILVPFPIESALSGVMKPFLPGQKLWYHRTFTAPKQWNGKRILLHFGAVDYDSTVWVNGQKVGTHQGGYDAFTCDVTDALKAGKEQDLVVSAIDPTNDGSQAHGKQTLSPAGAAYTASSGIWQTVWLEPLPESSVAGLKITPDIDASTLRLVVNCDGARDGDRIEAEALSGGKRVALMTGKPGAELILPIKDAHLWSPDDPFLYDLKVRLIGSEDREAIDQVGSYFGMRKIAVGKDAHGTPRLLLNGKFIFQCGPLDQGFWPDGIYTAPTDDALKSDLEYTKVIGFNMVRKHVKIEPDRWYYWADRLGLLVWQDMPAGELSTPESRTQWEMEMERHIEDHYNHPSIVMWVLFNEGWGQYDTPRLVARMREMDGTRLINNASGWHDSGAGDVVDEHFYPGPGAPRQINDRAVVTGEFGGLGYVTPGHMWKENAWGYQTFTDRAALTDEYLRLWQRVYKLRDEKGLSAAVYTQTSDVEEEANGLLTYDRAIEKIDRTQMHSANADLLGLGSYRTLLPDTTPWRYTTMKPPTDWAKTGFDTASWATGSAPFGSSAPSGITIGTPWMESDLWLRSEFTVGGEGLHRVLLQIEYGVDSDIYINGVLACSPEGFLNCFGLYELNPEAAATIKSGSNIIAAHVIDRKKGGKHYFSMELVDERTPAEYGSKRLQDAD